MRSKADSSLYSSSSDDDDDAKADILTNQATKRKIEWKQMAPANDIDDSLTLGRVDEAECPYFVSCRKAMKQFLEQSGIDDAMFTKRTGNRCFCPKCHSKRGDKATYYRGNPSQIYVLPIGYARFGINLISEQKEENILDDWHVVYHGTKASNIKGISESGLILLKPNDCIGQGPKNEIRSGHINEPFERTNAFTKRKEMFDPIQIFTSPSCKYSSLYSDEVWIGKYLVSFMFQCRQKPDSYSRGQETLELRERGIVIDKYVSNDEIEFYTKDNLELAITGILIQVQDVNDCKTCGGNRKCKKCVDGIHKKERMCKRCEGTGRWTKRSILCKKCRGTGAYKPRIICRFCSGSGLCKT